MASTTEKMRSSITIRTNTIKGLELNSRPQGSYDLRSSETLGVCLYLGEIQQMRYTISPTYGITLI